MSNVAPNRTLVLATPATVEPHRPQRPKQIRVAATWATPPEPEKLAMLSGTSEVASALRVIRRRLERKRMEGARILQVTSARRREGKTTLAVQLALCLSEANRARVLLIEADFAAPAVAATLGFEMGPGEGFSVQLEQRMHGEQESWLVHALGPSLHVLAEKPGTSVPEAIHSVHFQAAVAKLAESYHYVIIDAPSVLDSGDAHVIEAAADGVILAARSGGTRGSDLRAATKNLGDSKLLGVVLWDCA